MANENRVVYVTGAGKCGTHLVARYLAQNCDWDIHPTEYKGWIEILERQGAPSSEFIFHCPGMKLSDFGRIFPHGESLVLLRHPIQNYIAWTIARLRTRLFNKNLEVGKSNVNWDLLKDISVFHESMTMISKAFKHANDANYIWRLEDFTASTKQRIRLLREVCCRFNESSLHDSADTEKRTLGASKEILPVTESAYPLPLTTFEREALSVFDEHFAVYYPDWAQSLDNFKTSDEEALLKRAAFCMQLLSVDKKLILFRKSIKNKFIRIFNYLKLKLLKEDIGHFLLSRFNVQHALSVQSSLPEFSRSILKKK